MPLSPSWQKLPVPCIPPPRREVRAPAARSERIWRTGWRTEAGQLRWADPMAELAQELSRRGVPEAHWSVFLAIATELYANAVEHGVLKLDSRLKASPAGHAAYYQEKARRLARARTGLVRLMLEATESDHLRSLRLEVCDSGPGFCYREFLNQSPVRAGYHGRGIALVQALAADLCYSGCGNHVTVAYSWSPPAVMGVDGDTRGRHASHWEVASSGQASGPGPRRTE